VGDLVRAIWIFITDFGDTAVTVPLAALMALFLVAAREPRLAIGWCVAIVACAGAIGAMKLALADCAHPLGGPGLSSPSGHTAMGTAVYGGFAAVAGAHLAHRSRAVLIGGAAALIGGIALSRAILAHSVIEVAVGLAVGSAALAAILAYVARHRPRPLPLGRLALAVLLVALLFHGARWPAERAIHRLAGWFDMLRPWCG
jgi:membrane-associated phospholipid phosphatase